MNPLVAACQDLAQSGYNGNSRVPVTGRFQDPSLLRLGSFLLGEQRRYELPVGGVALAFGGGIDSYCAYKLLIKRDTPNFLVHVDYGQPYYQAEERVFVDLKLSTLSKTYRVYERANIINPGAEKSLDFSWQDYIVPCRNLVLAALASQYADEVWIVATKRSDETVGALDKTSHFFSAASEIFSNFYGRRITVKSPFFRTSRREMVEEFLQEGGTMDELAATTSCYSPVVDNPNYPARRRTYKQCGWCYACFKRYNLFQSFNYEYNFAKHPQQGPRWNEYQLAESKKRG